MREKTLILAGALALAAVPTGAQTVWRCGNDYSTQPCAGGSSFEVAPAPTKADAAQAEKAARIDAERAAALEKARLQQERDAPKAIVMGPAEPAKPVTEKKPKGKGKPEAFKASTPAPAKKAK